VCRMRYCSDPERIICGTCATMVEDWADINITNIIQGYTLEMILCTDCLYMLSLLLDVDLEENPEGLFQLTEFGKIEHLRRDNN